ncbi:MAG: CRTAC1 family protein [Acidobacteria bacterium]|nr:CRTAC1 family protein [Acidobacteriota bacterium]
MISAIPKTLVNPQNNKSKEATAIFVANTEQAGIRFKHESAASAEKYLVETIGSGCAFLDYDQDGFLDVFFVNGGPTPAYQPAIPPCNSLYRSRGDGTFTEVTERAGLSKNRGFGMGTAVGDFDNDGFPDIYVTGFHASALFHNNGNGTFRDITQEAGVGNKGQWGTSAAWFDFDNDGYLDLIVTNYLDYDYTRNAYCGERKPGFRMYCHPQNYDGVFPSLFRNNRDRTFTDITIKAGLTQSKSKGLGVVAADFNNDGWTDIFVANDSIRNLLYLNKENGSFEDVTLSSGTGYSEEGVPEAGMGVDAADYDGDGLLDIYITHLDFELNRLYRNQGSMIFSDATMTSGLGRTAILNSGFGTRFFDFDNDGWRDLIVINGHVLDNVNLYRRDVSYAERKILYRNVQGRFRNVSGEAGAVFSKLTVGRGLALGDYDNDGDVDLLVSNNNQEGELIRNDGGNKNNWIGIRLIGVASNRDGIGARLKITAGAMTGYDQSKGGMSYLSASDLRIYFGLGNSRHADSIEVHWPSGKIDTLRNVDVNRVLTIREGAGEIPYTYPRFR